MSLNLSQVLIAAFNKITSSIKVEVNTENITGDSSIGGDLSVVGDATLSGFMITPYVEIAETPFTISQATPGKVFVVNYTDTGAVALTLNSDLLVDGLTITVKDGELNAATNNITISTEGAETIDEQATYVMDADGESVTLVSDGSNWFVMNGFGE